MYQKILVPVDGSDAAFSALDIAANLLDEHGGSLILLHVVPEAGLPEGLEEWATVEFKSQSPMWRYDEAVGGRIVDAASQRAAAKGCSHVETTVARGDPATRIIQAANDSNADAIVIGTRGLTAIKSLVVGSVAQKVLHRAACPVVAVH